MYSKPTFHRLVLVLSMLALAACSRAGNEAERPAAAEQPAAAQSGTETSPPPLTPGRTPAPENARVYFITPADGAAVSSPVRVEFGIDGMAVVPAGQQQAASGHHHVIIDSELPPMNRPIPADQNHVHFGDGSSSTELELEPGEHTLQLLFADHLHIPHDPPVVSERITITVE